MDTPQIFHGVPIPGRKAFGRWVSVAEKMAPGDSVLVHTRYESTALIRAIKDLGHKGISRKVEGGIMAWKTKE